MHQMYKIHAMSRMFSHRQVNSVAQTVTFHEGVLLRGIHNHRRLFYKVSSIDSIIIVGRNEGVHSSSHQETVQFIKVFRPEQFCS